MLPQEAREEQPEEQPRPKRQCRRAAPQPTPESTPELSPEPEDEQPASPFQPEEPAAPLQAQPEPAAQPEPKPEPQLDAEPQQPEPHSAQPAVQPRQQQQQKQPLAPSLPPSLPSPAQLCSAMEAPLLGFPQPAHYPTFACLPAGPPLSSPFLFPPMPQVRLAAELSGLAVHTVCPCLTRSAVLIFPAQVLMLLHALARACCKLTSLLSSLDK